MSGWSGRPDLPAGGYPRAEQVEAILDQISSLTAPGWTTFAPVWTAGGGSPAIGNGTLTGRYRRPNGSDLILAVYRFVVGSTTVFGTTFQAFSLPVTASATSVNEATGPCIFLDSSAGSSITGNCRIFTSTTIVMNASAGGSVTSIVPITWAAPDEMRMSIWYEPA